MLKEERRYTAMRICPVSGSSNWTPFYISNTGRIMTGDQRIGNGNLRKIICPESGVVANENPFTHDELEVLYGEEYELNTVGREEHFFYTARGPEARSKVFFDWIEPYLPEQFETLIEIGCGEGNLLYRFSKRFSKKQIIGFDGSRRAVELAKKKGLNVKQKLIEGNEAIPEADVFILVNVIEHIEEIDLIISSLKKAMRKNGRIIFCLPIQDYGGYDIFFAEHVWHFTARHFITILSRNGLETVYSDVNHPINHGVGLFVCEKACNREVGNIYCSDIIKKNLIYWENNFMRLDALLNGKSNLRIAVFGAGEVFTLFMAFTSLRDMNIIACVDDTKQIGSKKHGIPIYTSEWLKENKVDLLLLAVNKKYHDAIEEKFKDIKLNIQPIY